MSMNSPLARYASSWNEPNPHAARAAAREAWITHGIVLINPAWLGEWDRAQAVILAEKLFGERVR